jgi:hypothetical protein
MVQNSVSQTFQQLRTTSQPVGAHAHHLRRIPHTQNSMQVNRRNITLVVKVTITTFSRIMIEGQGDIERKNLPTFC